MRLWRVCDARYRDILERWAADTARKQRRATTARVSAYVQTHPNGWDDDPADFFPGIAK